MRTFYRCYAYLGLASIFGSLLFGFRYDPAAPAWNVLVNVALYAAFAVPHLVMTRAGFKKAVWGDPAGSPAERRVYVTVTVVTWLAVYAVHLPTPGPALVLPEWLRFAGLLGFIVCIMAFFQGATFAMLDGLLGVPGGAMSHSHGGETPLMTSGPYADVRHPMYRAAVLAGLCSLVVNPNAANLLWAALIMGTFVAFIPFEERQLVAARGEAYREYQRQTPYRLFRGVW